MRWFIALHIIGVVCWFAGLFYLPRLFVYHANAQDTISLARFKIMERRLYYGIMTPAAILTIAFGLAILSYNIQGFLSQPWMHAKLFLVLLLVVYHFYCGYLRKQFFFDQNKHSATFYRWFNEIPTILLIAIIILVVVQPF